MTLPRSPPINPSETPLVGIKTKTKEKKKKKKNDLMSEWVSGAFLSILFSHSLLFLLLFFSLLSSFLRFAYYFPFTAHNRTRSSTTNGGLQSGRRLRLSLQGCPHRRLRRRQVQPPFSFHQERVQLGVQVHHWGRVRHSHLERRFQSHQGPDLGHRRPRKVLPLLYLLPLLTMQDHA